MATPGRRVEKDLKESEIVDALKRNRGLITYAAKELGMAYETLVAYLNRNPHVNEIYLEARRAGVEARMDSCEKGIDYLINNIKEDPAHAFKSIQFVLNNHGRSRGYAHPDVTGSEKLADAFSTFNDKMKEKENERKQRQPKPKKRRSDSE